MNDHIRERETIYRADETRPLTIAEMAQVEGGASFFEQVVRVAKTVYDLVKFSGGPVV